MSRRQCFAGILWTLGWTVWATDRVADGIAAVQAERAAEARPDFRYSLWERP